MSARHVARAALRVLAFALLLPGTAISQTYPSKAVRIVVAQAPGGASDLLIRFFAQKLAETLGQPFVIDNRPGAGGNIGAEIAAKAAADGYNLFMVSAPHAIAPSLYRKLSYSLLRDFQPVSQLGFEPLCLVVHPSLPVKTVREFAAFLKGRPGQVSYGSTGNGAVNHLAAELFKSMAGVSMVHVPYKGSAFAIPDVINGTVPVLFANVSPLLPQIRAGKLRAVGVTGKQPVAALPGVPPIAHQYRGYEAVNWFGLVSPANTPDDIVQRLNDAVRQIMGRLEVKQFYLNRSAEPVTSAPGEMRDFLRAEMEKWAEVVRASGARVD